MASPPPTPPSPATAESPAPPAATTVGSLSDDLLREIFLRLHSLPSLVRAALACRTFLRAVLSSPAFRRRFHEARPPPLLGLFFDPDGPAIPSFAPLRRRSDPDLVAAVRGADLFLTRVPDGDDASPGWIMSDCRYGYVLLINGITDQFAAYNPLTQSLDLIPQAPEQIFDDSHGYASYLDSFILSTGEGDRPLRVVNVCCDESRARAAVFSSETRDWQLFPWSEEVPYYGDKYWLKAGTMVNEFIYWIHARDVYMLVLNTLTLEFSQMNLPACFEGQGHLFRVGETKDGKLCIVCPIGFSLFLWCWRTDDNGVEKWILDRRFELENIVEITEGSLEEHVELNVLDIIHGFVYFSTGETFADAHLPCWFLSLCLETAEVEKLFQKKFDSHIRPYIMAWPPSLVHNKVHPQLEGA